MELADKMQACRTYGHAWDEHRPLGRAAADWILWLRCTRCTTERQDIIGNDGKMVRRRYIYPALYRLGKDERRPTRDEMRLELARRRGLKLRRR